MWPWKGLEDVHPKHGGGLRRPAQRRVYGAVPMDPLILRLPTSIRPTGIGCGVPARGARVRGPSPHSGPCDAQNSDESSGSSWTCALIEVSFAAATLSSDEAAT